VLQRPLHILLADGLPGLFGRPRGEGAPVGRYPATRRHRLRKLGVALRDLQVAEDGVGDGGDALDVSD
jgi:hypothetical protein